MLYYSPGCDEVETQTPVNFGSLAVQYFENYIWRLYAEVGPKKDMNLPVMPDCLYRSKNITLPG